MAQILPRIVLPGGVFDSGFTIPSHPSGGWPNYRDLDVGFGRADVAAVKTITLARFFSLLGISLALLGAPVALSASSHSATIELLPLSDGTFSITATAKTGFSRDTEKLKAEASDEAAKYCASLGKQLKVVELTAKKPWFSLGYASATIVFKAVNPGEPEVAASAPGASAAPVAERTISTDELVSELTKLDDLRKKGILSDEEFQIEKKKVLARSK